MVVVGKAQKPSWQTARIERRFEAMIDDWHKRLERARSVTVAWMHALGTASMSSAD